MNYKITRLQDNLMPATSVRRRDSHFLLPTLCVFLLKERTLGESAKNKETEPLFRWRMLSHHAGGNYGVNVDALRLPLHRHSFPLV